MTRWSCENALLTTTFVEKGKMCIEISYQYNHRLFLKDFIFIHKLLNIFSLLI